MSDNLLINKYPKVASEWHHTKNEGIILENITCGTNSKVWWICEKKKHEWQANIINRTYHESGCPQCFSYCKPGKSLLEMFPNIAKQWHPTLNGDLKPDKVSYKSSRQFWWICDKQHIRQQRVTDKIKSKFDCLKCHLFENSLGTKYPELAKMWDYEKNKGTPFEIWPSSKVIVYWLCEKKHSSKTDPTSKIKSPNCQYCIGKLATPENNFGTTFPDLIKFWNYDKNNYKPEELHVGSNKLIYWICEKGHEWERKILNVVRYENNDCSVCYLEENNLTKLYPKIASEWDYDKNGDLTPENITFGMPTYVWWKCTKDHIWKAQISSRTAFNSECPQCVNKGYSKIGLKWLEEIAIENNIYIEHAGNGGEHKIEINGKKIKVDGFCEETNTVYEFLGCMWHFHPSGSCLLKKGKITGKNPVNKKYNIDLYMNTIERLMDIEKAEYNLVYIWECEYLGKTL